MNKLRIFKIDLVEDIQSNSDIDLINNEISNLNIINLSTSVYLDYLIITIIYKEGFLND